MAEKLKTITISDFKGGKNTRDAQVLIPDNECASGTVNCWAPYGSLIKTPGLTLVESYTATSSGLAAIVYAPNINTAYDIYIRTNKIIGNGTSGFYPYGSEATGASAGPTPLGYSTGTVSVSGASLISATGNGTSWSSHVSAGDAFRINVSSSAWVGVASVEDNTHLTLSAALPAAAATGSAYLIQPALDMRLNSAASLNGSLWSCSTANVLQRYDGTGMTRITAGPKAAFMAVYKNYLFAARTSTAESRLYWSAIKDPTSWPSNNFIDIDKDSGKITGLFSTGNEILVFKTRGLQKVIGDTFDSSNPSYTVVPIHTPLGFGFNSQNTIALWNGLVVFSSFGDIYVYRPGTNYITRTFTKAIVDINSPTGDINSLKDSPDNAAATYLAWGTVVDQYYLLKNTMNSPDQTKKTLAIGIFGPVPQTFQFYEPHSGISPEGFYWTMYCGSATASSPATGNDYWPFGDAPMTSVPGTTGAPVALIGSDQVPKLYSINMRGPSFATTNQLSAAGYIPSVPDPTTAIKMAWVSKEFNIGYGTFKNIIVYFAKSSTAAPTVQWSIDQGTFVSNSPGISTGRGQVIRVVLDVNQKGSTIQLKITENTDNATVIVYGIQFNYYVSEEERVR